MIQDEPPPSFEVLEEFNELEARVDQLERRITELETVIDGIMAGEDSLRSIPETDEDARGEVRDNEEEVDRKAGVFEAEATFYAADCEGCIGITKTGYDVRKTIYSERGRRIIAVDPDIIPLGSIANIKLENGDGFEAEALDIGGDIKGARIDVLVATKSEAYRLGRQAAEIEIIKEGDR